VTIGDSGGDVDVFRCEVFPMSRVRWIGLGALALVLGHAPVPPAWRRGRRHHPLDRTRRAFGSADRRLRPGHRGVPRAPSTAWWRAGPTSVGEPPPSSAVRSWPRWWRCATFEGQRYCLGTGWTDRTRPRSARRRSACSSARSRAGRRPPRQAISPTYDALRQAARMSPVRAHGPSAPSSPGPPARWRRSG
jgi:hypothetical protein